MKKNTVIALFSLLPLSLPALAHAGAFEPVREDQVSSGTAYLVTQPAVEDAGLFRGKRVAILAANGVEEGEVKFPYDYLVARGAQVDVLVPEWSAQGIVAVRYLKPTLWVEASGTFRQGQSRSYDLLILTGGAWNAQVVRSDADALKLIEDHYRSGKPVAAICAGTSVLINSGIARGQRLTGSPPVSADLVNAGADFVDAPLVMGERLATSRTPNDLPEFVEGIRKLLIGR